MVLPLAREQSLTGTILAGPPSPTTDSRREVSSGRVFVGIGAGASRTSLEYFESGLIAYLQSPSLRLYIRDLDVDVTGNRNRS